jgi:PAS domain-containing protein
MNSLANSIGSVSEAVVGCLQQLVPTNDESRNRENFCRKWLEALPAAIYTTDPAGRITFCNQAAVELGVARRSWVLFSQCSWQLLAG